ncbi:MAG: right-handed parallel beta-helix repeat-containing protein [Elusimicrobia bacterium]|nr:right-handed parallel beta-helix repeat-containing protein [Elusimicrobiota bacterium]
MLSACHDMTVRNINLSGPVGSKIGTGLSVDSSSNLSIVGALIANRDVGIKMYGACVGNLLANNTITDNNTGMLFMQPCSAVSIVNSIIWGNTDDVQDQTGLIQFRYSDVKEALLPGTGNISADPLFINAALGNFRLQAGSPCTDAGTNDVAVLPPYDLAGNSRIQDGNNDGIAVVDMGAYESGVVAPIVTLVIKPKVLNLKSEGEFITAELRIEPGSSGCFRRETINISAVNGQALAEPIFAQAQKGKGYTLDCGSTTVKFSREAIIVALPVNVVTTITVSGIFADGRAFHAEDTVKTIKPFRVSEGGNISISAADPVFRLGEVYVFPNPAKGGKVPTFHVEAGLADSVKIRVYTVAGQLAHERTITGSPQVVGSAYAYEYAWEGRIASGVYYYTIEAEKGGQKFKAKGKFAVVR